MKHEIKTIISIKGMEEIKGLLNRHDELVDAVRSNIRCIENTLLEVNLTINQPTEDVD